MSAAVVALLSRLCADRKGVTAVMAALGAMVLMGFAGLGSDVVVWEFDGSRMRSATDQAALAGAVAASADYDVTTAAKAMAASYGYIDGQNGTTVSVNSNFNNVHDVQVTISQVQPQYFTRFFLSAAPTVTQSAVAQPPGAPSSGSMCVLALDQSGKLAVGSTTFTGTTNVQLDHCDLYNDSQASNGTELSGTANLLVQNMYLVGSYTVSGDVSLTVTGKAATWVMASSDPYANSISIPSYSGCHSYSDTPQSNTTITPSGSTPYVICGNMNVQGTLTLGAGTYVIDGGNFTAQSQAKITGTGVTIILTSSSGSSYGAVTINGGATLDLTAPTADASAGVPGVAIWVDKNAPLATDTFNGGTGQVINGAIYMPSQAVNYTGGSSTVVNNTETKCSQLIALTISFSGNSYFTHAGCSAADLPVKDPLAPPKLSS